MTDKTKRKCLRGVWYAGGLAVVFVFSFFLFTLSYSWGTKPSTSAADPASNESLPYDALRFTSHQSAQQMLRGRPTLILVADTSVPHQLDEVRTRAKLGAKHPFNLVIISSTPSQLAGHLTRFPEPLYTEAADFSSFIKVFKMKAFVPEWLMYDDRGTLQGRGLLGSDTLPYFIKTIVDSDSDFTAEFLRVSAGESVAEELKRVLQSQAPAGTRTVAILLLESARSACPEFPKIMAVRRAFLGTGIPVAILPVGKLSAKDARKLAVNFDLPFQVVDPTPAIRQWWSALDNEYGAGTTNASVLVFDLDKGISKAAVAETDIRKLSRI